MDSEHNQQPTKLLNWHGRYERLEAYAVVGGGWQYELRMFNISQAPAAWVKRDSNALASATVPVAVVPVWLECFAAVVGTPRAHGSQCAAHPDRLRNRRLRHPALAP